MYLKKIAIKNIGPIDELIVDLPFTSQNNPKPIIFVGENGSGKTILQAQIIDSFYEIGSNLFEDIGKQKGLSRIYYKNSGGLNLQLDKEKGFSALTYIDDQNSIIEYIDKIGEVKKEDITKLLPDFILSPNIEKGSQKITTNVSHLQKERLQTEWRTETHFYQPAYRYEEPFWKNDNYLKEQKFEDKRVIMNQLNKDIEIISATKENKIFLLDLVLDRYVQDANRANLILWEEINKILRMILRNGRARFGIGPRSDYRVSIMEDLKDNKSKQILPSIDNLSLGESVLLNLFMNIIRNSGIYPKPLNLIRGIIAIDEIDVHLHTDLQNSVLPELIKLFPQVQFVITTHSPLFLLGMKKIFGDDGFEIRNMPNGEKITIERFTEFGKAYEVLKNTEMFEKDLQRKILENKKAKVYVEGPTDVKYVKKAIELFQKTEILKSIEIEIIGEEVVGGTKNSNNKALRNAAIFLKTNPEILTQKVIILNDPEESDEDLTLGEKLYVRKISKVQANPIQKGIENLFKKSLIDKARVHKDKCFQFQTVGKEIKDIQIVNGKKMEVCIWICENGTKDDFSNYFNIIEIIENILSPKRDGN